jgi:hypothetical protein
VLTTSLLSAILKLLNKLEQGELEMGWYDGLNVTRTNFRKLASQFAALQLPMFSKNIKLVSRIMDGIAYADPKSNAIVVSDSMLNGANAFYDGLEWDVRLELFDAVIVHEVGHFMYSPDNLKGFQIGSKFNSFIATTANLLEDLYIEDQISNKFRYFEPLLIALNKVVINDNSISLSMSRTTGEEPQTLEEAADYLNYCISYKRREKAFEFRTDFEKAVYEKIYSVFDLELDDRKKLVYEVYEMIFKNVLEEADSQSEEKGEGNEEKVFDASFAPDSSAPKDVDGFNDVEVFNNIMRRSKDIMAKQYSETFVKVIEPGQTIKEYHLSNLDFSKLSVIENARGAVRIVRGAPQNKGKTLNHLHRAMDDGKVFSKNYLDGYRANKGAPEVVFLVDLSGSMYGEISAKVNGHRTTKIEFALSSIVAFNKSLRGTKTKFSIIGHTTIAKHTKYGSTAGLLIVNFKGFNEVVSDDEMLKRTKAVNGCVQYSGNADGAALLYAKNLFSSGGHDKILFIVSDGQPAENFTDQYKVKGLTLDGCYGIVEDVREIAKFIRRGGVKLFSASIDYAAIDPCNTIYGRENNVMISSVDDLVNMVMRSLN